MELVYNLSNRTWCWWAKGMSISPTFSTREEAQDWYRKYELIFNEG